MNAMVKPEREALAPVSLLQVIERAASNPEVDIDKMERLMQMHERIVARDAEAAFNEAMSSCQKEMRAIAADAENPQTRSRYATYAALDKALRPIYTEHDFSISYNTADSVKEEHVRVLAYVSRGAHTRTYQVDMPADGKGAKGGDVMTKTHATGSATQYGMRYLLKMIFNIAIGVDIDDDGNGASGEGMNESVFADFESAIDALVDKPSAEVLWKNIAAACSEAGDMVAYKHLKAKITAKGKTL